jgi:hypothetical protein
MKKGTLFGSDWKADVGLKKRSIELEVNSNTMPGYEIMKTTK